MNHRISACFFPTRVLFVDDVPAYLKNLVQILDQDTACYEIYSDPVKVLGYLSKDYKPTPLVDRIVVHSEGLRQNQRSIEVNIDAIHQEVYNADRFLEISVLAIDYSMPGLTGSEVCERLKGSPFKKMMLTSEADSKLAIDLLNRKVVDQFIHKRNPDFTQRVNQAIKKLQKEYFANLTQLIINSLIYSKDSLKCFQENEYLDLFNTLQKESESVEHYLLDNSGSFLFISFQGTPSYFVIRSEGDMKLAEDRIQASANPSIPALEAIRRREKLLFLRSEKAESPSWELSTYPAKKLLTPSGVYYYSYIKEPSAFDLDISRIVSFKEHLSKQA